MSLFASRNAMVVPDVIGSEAAAELRGRLESYTRYALVDRGSYDVRAGVREPELFAALVGIANGVTGRSLAVSEARALRLLPGDYLLAHHDRNDDRCIELVLDVSAAHVPGAEVHYRREGRVFFAVPSAPGTLSIVERDLGVSCNHTYVSKRHAGAMVVRVIIVLR